MGQAERILRGIPVSPGVAVARALVRRPAAIETADAGPIDESRIEDEVSRLHDAIQAVREALERQKALTMQRLGPQEAAIFDAHQMFLADPSYVGEMERRVRTDKLPAWKACAEVTDATAAMLAGLPDAYLRARADDIRDVGARLLQVLTGGRETTVDADSVLVTEEVVPSDLAGAETLPVALIAERGSRTAHAAILARSLGVPAVFGVAGALTAVQDGDLIIVDGDKGEVWVRPAPEFVREQEERARKAAQRRAELLERAAIPAVTVDGVTVEMFANTGHPEDARAALANGADGIGLMRTEFVYMERDDWPGEQEQYEIYREVLTVMGQRPVIIRTLDIGGDKPLPYASFPSEDNPFLGLRGLRFGMAHEEVLRTQLRALMRASVHGNLWIMLPMVTTLSEVRAVKRLVTQTREDLAREGVAVGPFRLGIMMETPAAAVMADVIAPEVDFFSIGTNDLTQYVMAADRGNAQVSGLYMAHHPAVLRLIKHICEAAERAGIPVGVCGELAGDATWAPLLVGLGVRELSMGAASIPEVKDRLRRMSLTDMQSLASEALRCKDADEVVACIGQAVV
jgi:phosphotransferase system enzyme I (PtsI)